MPRFYCDYCDTYLTHDSPSVRKQHNAGYKHKANVRTYYQQFEEQQTQSLIDQKVKEHLGQTYQQQVGASFHTVLQLGQYRPAVLPPPGIALPGPIPASSGPLLQTLRPPPLPRPAGTPSGFMIAPNLRPPGAFSVAEANGLPRPPILLPPGMQEIRMVTSTPPSSNGPIPAVALAVPHGANQPPSVVSGTFYGNYPYTAVPGSYPRQPPNLVPSSFISTSVSPSPSSTLAPAPTPLPAAASVPGSAPVTTTVPGPAAAPVPGPAPTTAAAPWLASVPMVSAAVETEKPLSHSSHPAFQGVYVPSQGPPSPV